MTANIAFALGAALLSLVVVVLAALKGDWWVVGVYAVLALGFVARARFGRRAPAEQPGEQPKGPEHEGQRQLRGARFKRR
jgi:hypothetical protein